MKTRRPRESYAGIRVGKNMEGIICSCMVKKLASNCDKSCPGISITAQVLPKLMDSLLNAKVHSDGRMVLMGRNAG